MGKARQELHQHVRRRLCIGREDDLHFREFVPLQPFRFGLLWSYPVFLGGNFQANSLADAVNE
ncbi:MAG: hypothetical protein WDN67_04885 [Candidatus Moraniibacteriota bacterium]